eukprot:4999147-Prymnesium_polylepis.1
MQCAHAARTNTARTRTKHIILLSSHASRSALIMRQSSHSRWALAARIGPPVTDPLLDDAPSTLHARHPRLVAPVCTVCEDM